MIKRSILICMSLIVIGSHCCADELEVVAGLDPAVDLPVLNEILRKKDAEIKSIDTRITALEGSSYTPTAANALAGSVVQVVNVINGGYSGTAGKIPIDDSIPQNTEGVELMTLAITPKSATNKLKIDVVVMCSAENSAKTSVALFQDTTAGALAAASGQQDSENNVLGTIAFTHYMTAGTTSSTTFKVRGGISVDTYRFYFNGLSAARIFGGIASSSITITEIKV